MPDGLNVKRRQFDLDPDDPDSDSIRIYWAEDSPAPPMPSVTTIKGVDKAMRGMRWATKAFKEQIIDTGHLRRENVIDVESFVFDTQYGYGGQFDLLYETDDGQTILSDLKTSSAIRFDHKLQSAAYKRAVESRKNIEIDQTEVIRLHPDSETVEIERSDEWDRSLRGLQHEFLALCDKCWNCEHSETLNRAKEVLSNE